MEKIVILSGAGMSAESGISTFRDSGGLWEQYRIEDVATPQAWGRNPELVLEFYNQRRRQLFEVEPNAGHFALAELEGNYEVQIITQNVDNLQERAGSSRILHLLGELMKMRSSGPMADVYDVKPEKIDYFIGDLCPKGYQLRPHIVWFGEDVPNYSYATEIVRSADLLIIIGTSMQVYPAAGLINHVKAGTLVYLIDPNDIQHLPDNVIVIKKGAGKGITELRKRLLLK